MAFSHTTRSFFYPAHMRLHGRLASRLTYHPKGLA
jgi:hypothetical protein